MYGILEENWLDSLKSQGHFKNWDCSNLKDIRRQPNAMCELQ